MGFLRYMRGSIGKRLTVKHLTTVCLQSDKGQVKQLSLYSQLLFDGLCGLLYTLAHIPGKAACRSDHALECTYLCSFGSTFFPKSSRSRSTVMVAPMSSTFPTGVYTTG